MTIERPSLAASSLRTYERASLPREQDLIRQLDARLTGRLEEIRQRIGVVAARQSGLEASVGQHVDIYA